jgi:hypothetical protein
MTKGIPFVKIADTVEVTVDLKGSESAGLRWPLSNRQPATLPAAALRRELWSMVNKESVNAATETTNHRWSAVSPFADPLKMEIQ